MISILAIILTAFAASPKKVWIDLSSPLIRQQVQQLPLGFIEQQQDHWYAFHVDNVQLLQTHNIPYIESLPSPVPIFTETHEYLQPAEFVDALQQLAQHYPELSSFHILGSSVEGRDIAAIRITASQSPLSKWRLLATHHGDELPAGELALHMAQYLNEQYAINPRIQNLLQEREIWIVPQVNPDGAIRRSRYNANAVDLNRNYDYQWSESEYRSGTAPFSEPETQAIKNWAIWQGFTGGLSLHTGATNLSWVWNYTTIPSHDESLAVEMASKYRDNCTDDDFWLINGADWYVTFGDTTDWSYGRWGTVDFTLEVSPEKIPPANQLKTIYDDHRDAILSFLEWPNVLVGHIVDGQTGQGISATILGPSGQRKRSDPFGYFSIPIMDTDPTTITIQAMGYHQREYELTSNTISTIALTPTSQLFRVQAVPPIHHSKPAFSLFNEAQKIQIFRFSDEPINLFQQDGQWSTTERVPHGVWSLLIDDQIYPNAIFVQSPQLTITTIEQQADYLVIHGEGFKKGSQLYSFSNHSPEKMIVLTESTNQIITQLPSLNADQILLVSNGKSLAFNLSNDATLPPNTLTENQSKLGCASVPPYGLLFLLLGLFARRNDCFSFYSYYLDVIGRAFIKMKIILKA